MNTTEGIMGTSSAVAAIGNSPFGFDETGIFSKHEFVQSKPWAAFPVLVFLVLASFVGTVGNVLTLLAITRNKSVRNVESMFIVNLAISDLYVTTVADPTSIIGEYLITVFNRTSCIIII